MHLLVISPFEYLLKLLYQHDATSKIKTNSSLATIIRNHSIFNSYSPSPASVRYERYLQVLTGFEELRQTEFGPK